MELAMQRSKLRSVSDSLLVIHGRHESVGVEPHSG